MVLMLRAKLKQNRQARVLPARVAEKVYGQKQQT